MRGIGTLLALGCLGSSCGVLQPGELHELDSVAAMQQLVADHAKVILYIQNGPCAECDAFLPDLKDIAQQLTGIPMGRIDGSKEGGKVASSFKVPKGTAVLRALFRNAPPGKRVLVRLLKIKPAYIHTRAEAIFGCEWRSKTLVAGV